MAYAARSLRLLGILGFLGGSRASTINVLQAGCTEVGTITAGRRAGSIGAGMGATASTAGTGTCRERSGGFFHLGLFGVFRGVTAALPGAITGKIIVGGNRLAVHSGVFHIGVIRGSFDREFAKVFGLIPLGIRIEFGFRIRDMTEDVGHVRGIAARAGKGGISPKPGVIELLGLCRNIIGVTVLLDHFRLGCGGTKFHGTIIHTVASTDFFHLFDSVCFGPNHGGFFKAHPREHF